LVRDPRIAAPLPARLMPTWAMVASPSALVVVHLHGESPEATLVMAGRSHGIHVM
jgi:hypothetical protein